jgi:hypothetical protein
MMTYVDLWYLAQFYPDDKFFRMENQPGSDNTHAVIFVSEETLNNNKVNTRYSITTMLYFVQNIAS